MMYTRANIPATPNKFKKGDKFEIQFAGRVFTYTHRGEYGESNIDDRNDAVLTTMFPKHEPCAIVQALTTWPESPSGEWPETNERGTSTVIHFVMRYAAASKSVRATMKKELTEAVRNIEVTLRRAAEEREKEMREKLSNLPASIANIVAFMKFDTSAFGCQRNNVITIACMLAGLSADTIKAVKTYIK